MVSASPRTFRFPEGSATLRRSSFADVGDVVPGGAGPPAVTFQVRPAVADCATRASRRRRSRPGCSPGWPTGVRTLAPGVSPGTFWGAVSPAGGEVPGADW